MKTKAAQTKWQETAFRLIAMVVAVLLTRRFFRGLRAQEAAQEALPPQES